MEHRYKCKKNHSDRKLYHCKRDIAIASFDECKVEHKKTCPDCNPNLLQKEIVERIREINEREEI